MLSKEARLCHNICPVSFAASNFVGMYWQSVCFPSFRRP